MRNYVRMYLSIFILSVCSFLSVLFVNLPVECSKTKKMQLNSEQEALLRLLSHKNSILATGQSTLWREMESESKNCWLTNYSKP